MRLGEVGGRIGRSAGSDEGKFGSRLGRDILIAVHGYKKNRDRTFLATIDKLTS